MDRCGMENLRSEKQPELSRFRGCTVHWCLESALRFSTGHRELRWSAHEVATLQLLLQSQQVGANTATLSPQAPAVQPRGYLAEQEWSRHREECTQGHSSRNNKGSPTRVSFGWWLM